MHHTIKTPISTKLICAAILTLSFVIMNPIEIMAAATEQRIAILPIDTDKAGNFAYLGPAIEEALNSRLYKPGIINVVSPPSPTGVLENRKAGSITDMKNEAKNLGAKYFITGEIFLNGKTPGLTLQLMETSTSKPIKSLSIKNAAADDVLTKIDGFVAETADAVTTGPQSVAEIPPQDITTDSNKESTIKSMIQDIPQKPETIENNAIATARINPDYFFYKKLDELKEQKDNTAALPVKSETKDKKAEREAKKAKEAYENMLPYPPTPSKTSESSKETKNTSDKQAAESLEKAMRKDGTKIPRVAAASKIPYPTPEEIEAKAAASAANIMPEMPSLQTSKAPNGSQPQIQTPVTQGSWLSWILNPFRAKKQDETHALNTPTAAKDKIEPTSSRDINPPDTAGAASTSDGPIWQWY